MPQPPAFQFYPRDWLSSSGTRTMSYAERGMYCELLSHQWLDGSIPCTENEISRLLGVTRAVWRKASPRVLSRFTIVMKDGRLKNKRLEEVRAEQHAFREERSQAGKKGAAIRWAKAQPSNGDSSAMHQPLAENSSVPVPASVPATAQGHVRENDTRGSSLEGGQSALIGPRVCPPSAKHAWCDGRMHVPRSLHFEFVRTGPVGYTATDAYQWYRDVDLEWGDKPIGDDAFTFWRARWREHHGTTRKSEGELASDAREKRNKQAGDEFERQLKKALTQ